MLNTIKEFARKHIVGTTITLLLAGFTAGIGSYRTLYEAKVNRVEEMKVEEFQSLVLERRKFEELLSAFTEELGTGKPVDLEKRREMSASLVRFYSALGAFSVNLPPEQEPPVKKLQISINEVKKLVQITETKQDLLPLGEALVIMFRDLKSAQPVLEQAVGKPFAAST